MARRYDPERRRRIIEAAIRIVELKGIAALSHRTVAAEAGVPLGSTTYHFAGLDDLLVAALEEVSSEPRSAMKGWAEALSEALPETAGTEAPPETDRTQTLPDMDRPGPSGEPGSPGGPAACHGEPGLADVLTRLLEEYAHGGRGRIRLEYELYLAALRRPALQPVAAAWLDEMAEVVGRHTRDAATARVLVALIDGLLLQLLLTDRPFDAAEVRSALARVTGES
ncbi:TetR/AcrR family transcriptional regulator [Streptomyces marispadix]|uniref:TetR family transcriptional regulator n=1 Tax=Streptomyces marispadix TaxID=2922868 RepID=A0ABS9STX5_9ACTN|nr:TetR family transcriptional regulator [Streptomyces marispadix]MCH6159628.1 TetR family transcriptional regulator [Streptomyces marispadix]